MLRSSWRKRIYSHVCLCSFCVGVFWILEAFWSLYKHTIRTNNSACKSWDYSEFFFANIFFFVRIFIFYMCCVCICNQMYPKNKKKKIKTTKKSAFRYAFVAVSGATTCSYCLRFYFYSFVVWVVWVWVASLFFCEMCALKSFSSFFIRFYFSWCVRFSLYFISFFFCSSSSLIPFVFSHTQTEKFAESITHTKKHKHFISFSSIFSYFFSIHTLHAFMYGYKYHIYRYILNDVQKWAT